MIVTPAAGTLFGLAGCVALAACLVHSVVGTRYALHPLIVAAGITPATRGLNQLCWHMATLLLLLMGVFLMMTAAGRTSPDTVVMIAIMASGTSLISASTAFQAGIHPFRFPATYLLGAVALGAIAGLALTRSS